MLVYYIWIRWGYADQKKLYVPRVEDKNRNMRMLNISSTEDLIANSMNILEPGLTDAEGNEREDGTFCFSSKAIRYCKSC